MQLGRHNISRARGVVVSHPLSMRETLGSIPSVSICFFRCESRCTPLLPQAQGLHTIGVRPKHQKHDTCTQEPEKLWKHMRATQGGGVTGWALADDDLFTGGLQHLDAVELFILSLS